MKKRTFVKQIDENTYDTKVYTLPFGDSENSFGSEITDEEIAEFGYYPFEYKSPQYNKHIEKIESVTIIKSISGVCIPEYKIVPLTTEELNKRGATTELDMLKKVKLADYNVEVDAVFDKYRKKYSALERSYFKDKKQEALKVAEDNKVEFSQTPILSEISGRNLKKRTELASKILEKVANIAKLEAEAYHKRHEIMKAKDVKALDKISLEVETKL